MQEVLIRHTLYFGLYIVFVEVVKNNHVLDFKTKLNTSNSDFDKLAIAHILLILAGFMTFALRISEPYVLQEFKHTFCCCLKNGKQKVKFGKESLNTFLYSSMNLELMSSILIGIVTKIEASTREKSLSS